VNNFCSVRTMTFEWWAGHSQPKKLRTQFKRCFFSTGYTFSRAFGNFWRESWKSDFFRASVVTDTLPPPLRPSLQNNHTKMYKSSLKPRQHKKNTIMNIIHYRRLLNLRWNVSTETKEHLYTILGNGIFLLKSFCLFPFLSQIKSSD